MPATSFTRHAWARVIDRLSLAPAEVAALLDYDLAVPIGSRGGTRHRLFYSAPDQQCFVAVQDEQNAAILTVLPIDFHESCAWPVSQTAQREAESLLRERPESTADSRNLHDGDTARVFRVGCYFRDGQGTLRPAHLGTLPADPFSYEVNRLLEDDAALDEIQSRALEKRRLGEVVLKAFVRLGRRGPVTMIDLQRYSDRVAALEGLPATDGVESEAESTVPQRAGSQVS